MEQYQQFVYTVVMWICQARHVSPGESNAICGTGVDAIRCTSAVSGEGRITPDVSLSQELLVSCIRSERGKALTRHIQPRHTKGFGARLVREMSDLSYNVTRQVAFHQPEVQSS